MDLSDFQQRILGFPQQANDDLERARWGSIGQMGLALLGASGRMTDGQRTAMLAQGLGQVQDPQQVAMTYAQQRLMQSAAQAKMAELQRQDALRQKLTDTNYLRGLGITPQMAEILGPDGITEVLTKRAGVNPLDDQVKRAQIEHLMRPEARTAPTPQMVDLPGGGKGWATPGSTTVTPIEGAGKGSTEDPKKTDTEVKGFQFANQTIDAFKKLADPEYQYALTSRAQQLANNIPYFASPWSSDDYRSADAASSAMTDAILRNKSGATIHDPEIQAEIRRVIPSPGDTPAQIADKVARQRAMIEGFIGAANPADRAGLRQQFDQVNRELLQKYSQQPGGSPASGPAIKTIRQVR